MPQLEQLLAGQLHGAQRLKLASGLREFPRAIFDLADSLEILDLSGNALSELPADLARLHKLRIIFCSDNQFIELPAVLGELPSLSMIGFKANRIRRVPGESLPPALRWLILTDNCIEELPAEIGQCRQMQKLMLAGNRLRRLPPELAQCTRLELLRIAANQLDALPAALLALPRLSWLAYAGNPFTAAEEERAQQRHAAEAVDWQQLQLQQRLGEGASGLIYHAEQHGPDGQRRPVAVKVFKGAVTSDGLPHCEMAACLNAGAHPALIPVLAPVSGHPEGKPVLLMDLIAPEFASLAGPPSFDSCTRDIYPPEARFSVAEALRLAHGIASAAAHLHRRGIMHGDLYAHNILHAGAGRALLGDFGAASFYDPADSARASALQRLEVRAFGCLLEELTARCQPRPQDTCTLQALRQLQADCLSERSTARPLFDDIVERLASLAELSGD